MSSMGRLFNRGLTHLLVRKTQIADEFIEPSLHIPHEVVATPEAEALQLWHTMNHLKLKVRLLSKPYTATLSGVIHCPGHNILLTKSRKVIVDSIVDGDFGLKYGIPTTYDLLKDIYLRRVERITHSCTSFQAYFKGYYHLLIDDLPRLYHLHQPQYADQEIKLLISKSLTDSEEFFLSKLLPENVKIFLVAQDTNYLADNYFFLSFLTGYGALPSKYQQFFVNRVCPDRKRKRSNRIYISRQNSSKGRRVLNEDELFDELSKYGFKKYVLEDIPIEEQIQLFYDSEYVIAPHGGGVVNILFAERIKLMELFPSRFIWSPVYYFLAKSMNHTYYYWCGGQDLDYVNFRSHLSEQGMAPGAYFKDRNFIVNVPEVLRLLEKSLVEEECVRSTDYC